MLELYHAAASLDMNETVRNYLPGKRSNFRV